MGLIKKQITDKNGHIRTVWVRPAGNLGILRRDMPQVTGEHQEAYEAYLKKNNVSFRDSEEKVKNLKPTQMEINNEKVESMMKRAKNVGTRWLKRPILVSSDNYILDGHHRWATLLRMDENEEMDIVKLGKPIKEILELTKKFPKVQYRDIDSPLPPADKPKKKDKAA